MSWSNLGCRCSEPRCEVNREEWARERRYRGASTEDLLPINATRPTIVCLCGSTKFPDAFREATLVESMAGRIVLSVSGFMHSDPSHAARITPEVKARFDELHRRKIDLADEILVLNVGGYIGESTRGEIEYAEQQGKRVRWLEPR